MSLLVLGSVTSTMDVAREMLKLDQVSVLSSGQIEPAGIMALDQTNGRGQRGRNWYARTGESLCVTYMVPIKHEELRTGGHLAILAGVAVIRSLTALFCGDSDFVGAGGSDGSETSKSKFDLKWPNDLMLNGKKLGGILVEVVPYRKSELVALIGVGINIESRRFPPELSGITTSLVIEGFPIRPLQTLANSIEESLRFCLERQLKHGFAATLSEWRDYDSTRGTYRIEVGRESGTDSCLGVAEAVDADGALVLRTEDGALLTVRSATSVKEIERRI